MKENQQQFECGAREERKRFFHELLRSERSGYDGEERAKEINIIIIPHQQQELRKVF